MPNVPRGDVGVRKLTPIYGLDPVANSIRLIPFVVSLSNHERNHL